MKKQYKIKRYYGKRRRTFYRAKPHPVSIVLSILLLCGLVFLGTVIYDPIYQFVMDYSAQKGQVDLPPDTSQEAQEPVQEQQSEAEPKPVSETETESLRAVYMPPLVAQNPQQMKAFLDALENSDVNAVLLDIKDEQGTVLFRTKNEQAIQWGAISPNAIDLKEMAKTLQNRNLDLIVREHAFCDKLAARGSRENAIFYQQTEWLWLDNTAENGGKPWLNPYAPSAREYVLSLALEAAESGAKMVVLDTVQFPVGSANNAGFGPHDASKSRIEILRSFVQETTQALTEYDARLAVYVPSVHLAQSGENTIRYGGDPTQLGAKNLLVGALAYQWNGGYTGEGLQIQNPIENPAEAVRTALDFAQKKVQANAEKTKIIAMVQGGNEPTHANTPFTRTQVDAQLEAISKLGLQEYILFSSGGEYLLNE